MAIPQFFGTQGNTKNTESQRNLQALLGAGVPQANISAYQTGQKNRLGTGDATSIFNAWSPTTPATPTPATPMAYGTQYPAFQNNFDPNQYLPGIQQQAQSIYQPQLQALESLRQLGQTQAQTAKVSSEADFQKTLQQEVESINRRGAFFSGGAKQYETGLQEQHARDISSLTLQAQAADFQNIAQQAGLSAEQAKYIQDQLYNNQSSSYNRAWEQYQQQYGMYNDQRTFSEQQRQFNMNLQFDTLKYWEDLGMKKKDAQAAQQKYKYDVAQYGQEAAAKKAQLDITNAQGWRGLEIEQQRADKVDKPVNLQHVSKTDILGQTISGTFNPATGEYKWDE